MDMRFTEITHMQLKKSLDQIHDQNSARSINATTPLPNYMYNAVLADTNVCYSQRSNEDVCMTQTNCYPLNTTSESSLKNFRISNCPYFGQCNGLPLTDIHIPLSNSGCFCPSQPAKFGSILQAKESMLQEKDSVISNLRLQVASLQNQSVEGNPFLQQVVPSNTNPRKLCPPIPRFSENQNLDHKAQKKINDLSQLLGEAEIKLSEKASRLKHRRKEFTEKIDKLKSRIKSLEQENCDLKKKQKSTLDKLEESKRRVECLESYLSDLPTIEETSLLKTEAGKLDGENESLVVETASLKKKLGENVEKVKEKENKIERLLQTEKEFLSQIANLRDELKKAEKSKEPLKPNKRIELEDLQYQAGPAQNERKHSAFLVSTSQNCLTQQQYKENIEDMQKKLLDAEALVESLRRDLLTKQQTAKKIHLALKNLSAHNKQLRNQKLKLQDQVKSFEKQQKKIQDMSQACSRLYRETSGAVNDVKVVTQVLIQTAKGSDPDVSTLLGLKSDVIGGEDHSFDQTENSITESGRGQTENEISTEFSNERLIEVRRLRNEVDELRTMLSNQYAESIGNNCITH